MTATHPSRARGVGNRMKKSSAKPEREALLDRMEMSDMRDHAVPCANATQFEIIQGKHMTWNDNQICTRCDSVLDLFALRRELAEQYEENTTQW